MSEQSKIVTPSAEEVAAYGGQGAESGSEPGSEQPTAAAAESPAVSPEEAAARSEAQEWRDRCLRARAELANYQKRIEKDRSEAMRYAHAELARALLPVIDDLERLIKGAEEPNATLETLVKGVQLTRDNFLKVLQQFHVLPIEAHGRPFDPNVHEALLEQASDHPERTVLQELAKGYKLHDRVLRPSKVIVSRSLATPGGGGEGETDPSAPEQTPQA